MNLDKNIIKTDIKEIFRYMGWKKIDEKSGEYINYKNDVEKIAEEAHNNFEPKYIYRKIHIKDMKVEDSNLVFTGSSIEKFLCDVEEAYLMVVTVGFEFENYVKQNGLTDVRKGLILDALGTELVEKCADFVENEIREGANQQISSRFSPGYGDFTLGFQSGLLDFLKADKIGVFYNDHNMMYPQKTVTAIVKFAAFNSGCKACEKKDCNYKKENESKEVE